MTDQTRPLQAGDVVTAVIDQSSWSDEPRDRPYSITGTLYEVEQYPGDLWLGGQLLVRHGQVGSWITVAVLVPAREQVSA